MLKTEAIKLLGGTIPAAAKAIGVSYQAVDKWPDELPDRISDRVQAYLYRQSTAMPDPIGIEGAPEVPATAVGV